MAASQFTRRISIVLALISLKTSLTTGCKNVISSDSGWFSSPNHPENYPDYSYFCWLINTTQPISFVFSEFRLDQCCDFVMIYNGPTSSSDLLLKSSSDPTFPIISTANQTLIVFTSDGSDSDYGFNATYSPFNCQYELSSESGSLTSPNYPFNYPPNTNCSWLITTSHPIILSFTELNLDTCCDFLTIYDGPTESSPLLLESSSNNASFIISTGHQILVTFTSDELGSNSGFQAYYFSYECQHILSSESGWFTTPNHPLNYPDNTNCRWIINATEPIVFSFPHLDINEENDRLKIYDGSAELSQFLLLEASSNYSIPPSISTTSNQALITFISDGPGSHTGFNATYSPYKCQYHLSSESGWFTSPQYPNHYPHKTNCNWFINATKPITISFTQFDLEDDSDWVTIYDGPTKSYPVLYKSSTVMPSLIVSTSNQILVTFTSDHSRSISYSGFNATYYPSRCQYITSSESGKFMSPNHPDNSSSCWLINATDPITVSFDHFHLETNKDWLKIYDGPTTRVELMKASSNYSVPSSVISSGNKMLVTFSSDASSFFSGFIATYQPYKCHYVLSADPGWFASPNYPLNYPFNSNCSWLINATNRISISFPHFEMEEGSDWLTVYDGPTTSSVELLKTSSRDSLPRSIVSTIHQILVTFTSNAQYSFSGFNATYSECEVQSSASGWLSSPNYPGNYPYGASLCWLINATVPLEFQFDDFHTENDSDLLRVYNGPTQSSERIFERTSKTLGSRESTASQILVTFTSDASRSFSGFNLTYYPGCRILEAHSYPDWFMSPRFPDSYFLQSRYCWLIVSTQPVMITFPRIHLEIGWHWLKVYDGPLNDSPLLLAASSNYTVPSSIVSTSHQILVTFTSASSLYLYLIQYSDPGIGFKLTYSFYQAGITERPMECNETIHVNSSRFSLTSLNYPASYPYVRCNWRFNSDSGTKIQIFFTDFTTQPEDYVSIFDTELEREPDNAVMIASGINSSSPLSCNYVSKSNWMHVSFNPFSDPSENKAMPSRIGFHAMVTATNIHGCGGNFSDPDGVLIGFEANAQLLMFSGCVWYVQVDAGSKVNLTLSTISESVLSKDSYSLKVYDGYAVESNDILLANVTDLSSLPNPLSILSNSNEIRIVLNDTTKYNSTCRPQNYPKLNLSYETIVS